MATKLEFPQELIDAYFAELDAADEADKIAAAMFKPAKENDNGEHQAHSAS